MFKRRSSKDLSAKIGYDHVNAKPSKKLDPAAQQTASSSTAAPVANVTLHNHQPHSSSSSSSSSSRKTTATTSPDQRGPGAGGGSENHQGEGSSISAPNGESPLASLKALPPQGSSLSTSSQLMPSAVSRPSASAVPSAVASSAGGGAPLPRGSSRSAASGSSSKHAVPAEPPAKSLVIGEGVLFEGTTEGCAAAVVGGRMKGTVKSRRLEITRAGKMEGTGIAETAEIAGLFEGNLTVTKALKICSTGRFKGEVSFGSIVVENGGKIEGRVNFAGCRTPMPESAAVPPPPSSAAPTTSKKVSSSAPIAGKKSSSSSSAPVATKSRTRSKTAPQPPQPRAPEASAPAAVVVSAANPTSEKVAAKVAAKKAEAAEAAPPVMSPE